MRHLALRTRLQQERFEEVEMRVLVVGTLPAETDRVATRLHDAGHEVVRCHDAGHTPFPCAGLDHGNHCPLDDLPVDVAITARDRPWPRPSPYEDGAVCALRRHIPLVVAGSQVHPFGRWTVREVDFRDDVVAACEEAAAAPLPEHTEIARQVVRDAMEHAGEKQDDTESSRTAVYHQHGRLRVELELPPDDHTLESEVTAKVLTALRCFDPHALGIDVSVV